MLKVHDPLPGDYCCVQIAWTHNLFGWHLPFGMKIPNFTGLAIRFFTWSRYDHAFVYLGDGDIFEAQPKGAKVSRLSNYDGKPQCWSATELTPDQRIQIPVRARTLVGTPYGFWDIVLLGPLQLGIPLRWMPPVLVRKVLSSKSMICSQVVAWLGQHTGVASWMCGQADAQLVTPGDLATLAEAQEHFKGIY